MSTLQPNVVETVSASSDDTKPASAGARVVVLYNAPADAAAFDAYYATTHVPLVKQMPGLRSYVVSKGGVTTPGAKTPPYHLLAELHFDSLDALNAALASPQGAAAVADVANFASAGVTISIVDLEELL